MSKRPQFSPSENHSFNVNLASKIKHVQKAIILKEVYRNSKFFKVNNKFEKDGFNWFFMSVNSIEKLFPYMSPKSVYRWIKELEKENLIAVRDDLNHHGYDKTKWFTSNTEFYEFLTQKAEDFTPENIKKLQNSDYQRSFVSMKNTLLKMRTPPSQNENSISQNENSISQNENSISQNERTILTSVYLCCTSVIPREREKSRKNEKNENPTENKIIQLKAKNENLQKNSAQKVSFPELEILANEVSGERGKFSPEDIEFFQEQTIIDDCVSDFEEQANGVSTIDPKVAEMKMLQDLRIDVVEKMSRFLEGDMNQTWIRMCNSVKVPHNEIEIERICQIWADKQLKHPLENWHKHISKLGNWIRNEYASSQKTKQRKFTPNRKKQIQSTKVINSDKYEQYEQEQSNRRA